MFRTVALIDWDGTLREDFTVRSWMRHLADNHLIPSQAVTELEHQFHRYSEGEISHDDLAKCSAEIYAKSVQGKGVEEIRNEADTFLETDTCKLLSLPLALLAELNRRKIEPIIITGAPSEVLLQYQKRLCLRRIFCLELVTLDGRFTGKVANNPGVSAVKREIVSHILGECDTQVMLAIGNSDSDVPIFEVAPLGVIVGNSTLQMLGRSIRLATSGELEKVLAFLDVEI